VLEWDPAPPPKKKTDSTPVFSPCLLPSNRRPSQLLLSSCYGRAIIFLPCGFFLLFLFFIAKSQRSQSGCLPYFYIWCGLSADLECRSEMCCTRLAEIQDVEMTPKSPSAHHCTTLSHCISVSSQLRHASTIGKKLVKQQYVLHTSSQYGELRSING